LAQGTTWVLRGSSSRRLPERWRTVEENSSDGGPEKQLFELYRGDLPAGVPRLAPGHDAMLTAPTGVLGVGDATRGRQRPR